MTGNKSWICEYEPESKQQTVWGFPDEPNPTKIVSSQSTFKQMVGCFFWKNCTCRNHATRTTQKTKFRAVHKQLFVSGLTRNHHDNAISLTSTETTAFLRF